MKNLIMNYETMLKIAKSISHSKDPEEVAFMTVDSIKTALDVKGCSLFLFNRKTNELELAASFGLSDDYINKGPVNTFRSIAQSLEDGPVIIYDVMDDPRIQYAKEAQKEGISSILSVPIVVGERILGAMRVYTSEPYAFTLDDANFVEALAQIAGGAINMAKYVKGLKSIIEVQKIMRDLMSLPQGSIE